MEYKGFEYKNMKFFEKMYKNRPDLIFFEDDLEVYDIKTFKLYRYYATNLAGQRVIPTLEASISNIGHTYIAYETVYFDFDIQHYDYTNLTINDFKIYRQDVTAEGVLLALKQIGESVVDNI